MPNRPNDQGAASDPQPAGRVVLEGRSGVLPSGNPWVRTKQGTIRVTIRSRSNVTQTEASDAR